MTKTKPKSDTRTYRWLDNDWKERNVTTENLPSMIHDTGKVHPTSDRWVDISPDGEWLEVWVIAEGRKMLAHKIYGPIIDEDLPEAVN